MNERLTLKSGVELRLQMATFAVGMKLLKAVVAELKQVEIGIALGANFDLAKLMQKEMPIDALKNVICQALASDAIEQATFDCMKVCLYAGEKITRDTFEDQAARQDFLPVAWEVIKFNLTPFFAGLDLKSSTSGPDPVVVPK